MQAAWKRSTPDATNVTPEFEFDNISELLDLPPLQERHD
jgi:hypothetical protein